MNILKRVRSQDRHKVAPGFKLGYEGGGPYTSYMGALCTFAFWAFIGIFLYSKILVLYQGTSITIIPKVQEGFLTFEDKFEAESGLHIAAAITVYDSNPEPIDDPRYGTLALGHYGWGYGEGISSGGISRPNHACSDDELGLEEHYPMFASTRNEVETWKKKFKCLDKDDLVIWGDYNSVKT